nr:MAG TPA: hypothetical protein [Caudoviricetes sp.]
MRQILNRLSEKADQLNTSIEIRHKSPCFCLSVIKAAS